MLYITYESAPVGQLMLASDGGSLTGLWLEGQKYYGDSLKKEKEVKEDGSLPIFSTVKDWLDRYFSGQKPAAAELPLAPIGGDFRKAVWELLCQIPYGEVTTYGNIARDMAARMNRPTMSSQAVGGAVAHNPISIIIPCHRVVGTGGSLTGYAGGLNKKIQLLELEGVDLSRFFAPAKGTAL